MTVGNPATNLIRFSTPLLIGNLRSSCTARWTPSWSAIMWVTARWPPSVPAARSSTCCSYCSWAYRSVPASWRRSISVRKDKKRLSHSVGAAITATFAVSIFVMVVGPLITHPIMSALQTPQDIYTMSCDYLIINFLGILGSAYYNIISGILRGLGDSVMPLIFLLVACGMNIGLDIWFVAGL